MGILVLVSLVQPIKCLVVLGMPGLEGNER